MPYTLDQFAANIKDGAIYLAAVATLSMAAIELLKTTGRLRMRYHRWSTWGWTANEPRTVAKLFRAVGSWRPFKDVSAYTNKADSQILSELLLLAAGGHDYANALYDQPIEKMMAQIQSAANVALEFPNEYPALYAFLTHANIVGSVLSAPARATVSANPKDLDEGGQVSDARSWKRGVDAVRSMQNMRVTRTGSQPDDVKAADAEAAGKARSRLNNLVARKLDAFQNETRYFWDRLNQWVSSIMCTVLLFVFSSQLATILAPLTGINIIFLLFGGIAAPFAKDVVTALASFGKKA